MKRTLLLMLVVGFAASASGVKAPRLKPPPAGSAAAPAAAKKDGDKPLSPEAAFRKRQEEKAAEDKKAAETAATASARRENCEAAQAQVRSIQAGQRMSTTNAQGERVFLDDTEIATQLARAQKAVADNSQ